LSSRLLEIAGDDPKASVFPYSRHIVNNWWNQIARDCGIRGVTLHGLRATYITTALDSGVAATEVQKLVGHSHLATTMRYYRNREVSREAAQKIGSALGLANGATLEPREASPSGSHSGRPDTHPAGARK
jgi:integrase